MKTSLFVSSGLALALAFPIADARADEPIQPSPNAAPIPATTAVASTETTMASTREAVPREEEQEFKHVTLTLNPLSVLLLRAGLNVEYLPTAHHAIVVNPYYQGISVSSSLNGSETKTSYSNFGGEVGYRFYTGSRGADGFFVGPSLLAQHSSGTVTQTGQPDSSVSANSYGVAIDLGGQHVFRGGFTIGGGIGLMYLAASSSNLQTSTLAKFDGVLPRFLFTVGWSL